MTTPLLRCMLIGAALLAVAPAARAQAVAPPPSETGNEFSNLGTLPFTAQEALLLRPEDRAAIRKLEDRHLKEARDLEDKYASDLLALRIKQAEERAVLLKAFRR
ncbi:MAG: hypothetical protein F9K44_13025 [Hyphomicrobiaceae bacterium]|nr:MAG: hypothetical protein F9K44_13025 [Hyphomicrobiaceae bacterium]